MHCWSLISFKCVFPQIWCSSATIPSFPYPSSCSCSIPTFSAGSPIFFHPKVKARAVPEPTGSASTAQDEQEDFQVLTAIKSEYNDILILDTPKSRLLLLDSTRMLSLTPAFDNVHSIFNKEEKRTGSYWVKGSRGGREEDQRIQAGSHHLDEFASLPAIVPEGPIAIFGLGGGTAAHLLLDLWPSLKLEGWEIDEILIHKSREYLGLSDLEKHNQAGGILHVHVGDALSPLVNVPGGFADAACPANACMEDGLVHIEGVRRKRGGHEFQPHQCLFPPIVVPICKAKKEGIIIDLFSEGKVLPQLQQVYTSLLDKSFASTVEM
ncbi:hypothetical protein CK203_027921 [Vitis vinifera]|uniref:Uncharacterized protein n=1 Tax=Vitis vinifera TaxID=29760 RepID=A0A438J3P0_VITVI|nr:hypothetical protein CK203_027921 [Vitis vinifera]